MSMKGLKLNLKSDNGNGNNRPQSPSSNVSTPPGTPKKRFNFASLAQKVMEQKKRDGREKEKSELKAKVEELEDIKIKYDQEKRTNEQLQKKIDQSLLSQSDTSKALFRSNELVERLRTDNKKKVEQIEKYQRDVSIMEDRMRNLEIRASEVEKAELILETTKQNLESTQIQVQARESEIHRLNKEQDDTTKQLETANEKIASLEGKIEDLKYQVRHELMKNENIEKNLETIPRLKDEIADRDKAICTAKKEIEEKTALLTSARKAVREYKDQTRDFERTSSEVDHLKNELEVSKCEVHTLKKLMMGKDHLVTQKSKALDLAKEVIQTMKCTSDTEQTDKIVKLIDRIGSSAPDSSTTTQDVEGHKNGYTRPRSPQNKSKPYSTVHHLKEIDINRPPYSSDPDCIHHSRNHPPTGHVFPDRCYSEDSRPRTAVVRPTINKSASFKEPTQSRGHSSVSRWHSQRTQNSSKKGELSPRYSSDTISNNKFSPSLDYTIGTKDTSSCSVADSENGGNSNQNQIPPLFVKRTHSDNSIISDSVSSSSDATDDDSSVEYVQRISKLSAKQKDQIISNFVGVGDRVIICVPQKVPRYGKKIAPKPINHTGIVKYKGTLDKQGYDPRLYIGVRLDGSDGDTDGLYKGKRYMFAPSDQGKFFKLRDISFILDVQTGKYIPVSRLFNRHFSVTQTNK